MVTGDNPVTAAAIAAQAGVDDFVAEAKPEEKLKLIRREQAEGRLVATTGDGTNDAPALAQADVGVAMHSGTNAAKEAANLIDLDSDPAKLIDLVGIGKQMLMTRGALTTFSIANDVAKYFAIIPAMFIVALPGLSDLNVMGLSTPQSAVLSALIFNALIIPALIPLALRGVRFRPESAEATHLSDRGQRPRAWPAIWFGGEDPLGGKHEPVLRLARQEEEFSHSFSGHGHVEAVPSGDEGACAESGDFVRQVPCHAPSGEALDHFRKRHVPGFGAASIVTSRARNTRCCRARRTSPWTARRR